MSTHKSMTDTGCILRIVSIIKTANKPLFQGSFDGSPLTRPSLGTLMFESNSEVWYFRSRSNGGFAGPITLRLVLSPRPATDFVRIFGMGERLSGSLRGEAIWNDCLMKWASHKTDPLFTLLHFSTENAYCRDLQSEELCALVNFLLINH